MTEPTKTVLIEAARSDFSVFAEIAAAFLTPNLIWSPYLDLVSDRVEGVITGNILRLVINLPPRHLKTIVASVIGSAWALGKTPMSDILSVSHSNTLARDIADKTFRLMQSPFYRECFPGTRIRDDRGSVMDFATTAGGSRLAGSFDTSLTGRGADLIIVDDPISAHDANSAKARESTVHSFEQMVVTRLNDPRTGAIMLVAQRLHENDLSGHLIERGYDQLKLPLEAESAEIYRYKGGVFRRSVGEVLQPERFGTKELAERKQSTPPHIFATQFQQEPTAVSSGTVRREDFLPFDLPAPPGDIVCSWDLAASATASSSYSVCLVFQCNQHGSYLIDVSRVQADYSFLKEIAFAVHDNYRPRLHIIESASLGPALAGDLKAHGTNVVAVSPGGASKYDRLLAQIHHIRGQRVFLPRSAPWLERFLDELVAFPHGQADDQVDALTQYLKWYGDIANEPPVPRYVSVGIQHGAPRSARMQDMILRNTLMIPPSPTRGLRRCHKR